LLVFALLSPPGRRLASDPRYGAMLRRISASGG
jgi:hypothetical protein